MDAPKLYPADKVFAHTILPLVPSFLRPNHFTVARFAATPLVLWLLWQEWYLAGTIAFILTALTDAIDGSLARARNQITNWGKVYDPLADKFLILSVMVLLVTRYLAPSIVWGVGIMEAALILGALLKRRKVGAVIQSNTWGKTKMVLQSCGVFMLLLGILAQSPPVFLVANSLFVASIVFGTISLLTYSI